MLHNIEEVIAVTVVDEEQREDIDKSISGIILDEVDE